MADGHKVNASAYLIHKLGAWRPVSVKINGCSGIWSINHLRPDQHGPRAGCKVIISDCLRDGFGAVLITSTGRNYCSGDQHPRCFFIFGSFILGSMLYLLISLSPAPDPRGAIMVNPQSKNWLRSRRVLRAMPRNTGAMAYSTSGTPSAQSMVHPDRGRQ